MANQSSSTSGTDCVSVRHNFVVSWMLRFSALKTKVIGFMCSTCHYYTMESYSEHFVEVAIETKQTMFNVLGIVRDFLAECLGSASDYRVLMTSSATGILESLEKKLFEFLGLHPHAYLEKYEILALDLFKSFIADLRHLINNLETHMTQTHKHCLFLLNYDYPESQRCVACNIIKYGASAEKNQLFTTVQGDPPLD